jgi:small subunit ribosomal protein S7
MPPRITLLPAIKTIPYRPKAPITQWRSTQLFTARLYSSSKTLPVSNSKKGPNTEQLPHVSEEAAAVSKIKGETGPDLNQGTPVQEVVKGDKAAQENLPKVMKEEAAAKAKLASGKRSFGTSAVRRDEYEYVPLSVQQQLADGAIINRGTTEIEAPSDLKFDPVVLPLAPEDTLRRRYDPVVEQFTGLIMQHGKKSVAQRVWFTPYAFPSPFIDTCFHVILTDFPRT